LGLKRRSVATASRTISPAHEVPGDPVRISFAVDILKWVFKSLSRYKITIMTLYLVL